MTAESCPTSLVNRLAISEASLSPPGYYRSKLFIAPVSTNTLIAAAGPLFSLLERLSVSSSLPPIEKIRDNIEHELQAFHSQLLVGLYSPDLTGIAQYLLCATVDELLGKSYLRVYKQAIEFQAFTPLIGDGVQPQEGFFEILSQLRERPNQYLDVIELLYFCLITGFEGKYHLQTDGRQVLDNTIEDLYQIIQQYRFNKPHRFFNESTLPPQTKKKSVKPLLISTVLAASVVFFAVLTSHVLLENKAKFLLSGHNQLAMLDN